eukprot:scaffold589_cov118-Isochrysis_galbana.AAC.3
MRVQLSARPGKCRSQCADAAAAAPVLRRLRPCNQPSDNTGAEPGGSRTRPRPPGGLLLPAHRRATPSAVRCPRDAGRRVRPGRRGLRDTRGGQQISWCHRN